MSASATQGGHNQLPINCTTTGIQPVFLCSLILSPSMLWQGSTEGKNKLVFYLELSSNNYTETKWQAAAVIIYVARFILLNIHLQNYNRLRKICKLNHVVRLFSTICVSQNQRLAIGQWQRSEYTVQLSLQTTQTANLILSFVACTALILFILFYFVFLSIDVVTVVKKKDLQRSPRHSTQ